MALKYTLNCCNEVNEGKTDWFRFKCNAALLRVESEMLRDIPFRESDAPLSPEAASSGVNVDINEGDEQFDPDDIGEFR